MIELNSKDEMGFEMYVDIYEQNLNNMERLLLNWIND